MARRSKIVSYERRGSRRQLVIRINLPTVSFPQWASIRIATNYLLSLVLLTLGVGGVLYSLTGGTSTPTTSATPLVVAEAKPSATSSLPRSIPVRLEVPDIGISTSLIQLGKNEDGSMETPAEYDIAGWYKHSPTPGEVGPAVITGHVDNYLGPAVFFDLKNMQPKQLIIVQREDATAATFQVERVEVFDQSAFPTDEVYGNIDYPGLRLITCGGAYDVLSGRYSHNVVVYASYVPKS